MVTLTKNQKRNIRAALNKARRHWDTREGKPYRTFLWHFFRVWNVWNNPRERNARWGLLEMYVQEMPLPGESASLKREYLLNWADCKLLTPRPKSR